MHGSVNQVPTMRSFPSQLKAAAGPGPIGVEAFHGLFRAWERSDVICLARVRLDTRQEYLSPEFIMSGK